jgi:hypothetical protein
MPKDENNICDDCGEEDTHVCYICSNKDSCIVCDNMGEYGPNKHIVCEICLPKCLECKRKLERRADKCCGKGRSDDDDTFLCRNCNRRHPLNCCLECNKPNFCRDNDDIGEYDNNILICTECKRQWLLAPNLR